MSGYDMAEAVADHLRSVLPSATVTVDRAADAAYAAISEAPVTRTLPVGAVNVDYDAAGNIVGVEVLTLSPGEAAAAIETARLFLP